MAVSTRGNRLDQLKEGNAAGGHAGGLEAIQQPAASLMTSRRFPPPWRAEPIPGGYVVRDADGEALAYLYSRDNPTAMDFSSGPQRARAIAQATTRVGWAEFFHLSWQSVQK
jgi:hypothetical protein